MYQHIVTYLLATHSPNAPQHIVCFHCLCVSAVVSVSHHCAGHGEANKNDVRLKYIGLTVFLDITCELSVVNTH